MCVCMCVCLLVSMCVCARVCAYLLSVSLCPLYFLFSQVKSWKQMLSTQWQNIHLCLPHEKGSGNYPGKEREVKTGSNLVHNQSLEKQLSYVFLPLNFPQKKESSLMVLGFRNLHRQNKKQIKEKKKQTKKSHLILNQRKYFLFVC